MQKDICPKIRPGVEDELGFPLLSADLLHGLPEGRPLSFLQLDFSHTVAVTGWRGKARMADEGGLVPELGGTEPRRFFWIIHQIVYPPAPLEKK
jgi:hypothetical protein